MEIKKIKKGEIIGEESEEVHPSICLSVQGTFLL